MRVSRPKKTRLLASVEGAQKRMLKKKKSKSYSYSYSDYSNYDHDDVNVNRVSFDTSNIFMTLGKKRFEKFSKTMNKVAGSTVCDKKAMKCVISQSCDQLKSKISDVTFKLNLKEGKRKFPMEYNLADML